jgi:neutral ceramidase
MRNWARAFVIKDPKGTVVVLVSCDTFAVPLSLTAHVYDNVEDKLKAEKLTLEPKGLLIAATHTHQGPGNYMDASAYNAFGSVRMGFSRPLFNFLVERVSDAIMRAVAKMKPAELRLYQGKVQGTVKVGVDDPFLVNRSPATFAQNYDADAVLTELGDFEVEKECPEKHLPGEPEDGWRLGKCPRLRAVDRRMLVLQAREPEGPAFANLVFFAVHPTVLIHQAPLFNSDFTGYAMDKLESNDPSLIAGFFNGAEGDITARRFNRDVLEVVHRGEQFLAGIRAVLTEPKNVYKLQPDILLRGRVINTGSSGDRTCFEGTSSYRLAETPFVGVAQPGGAELDRTIFFDFGWKTGVRSLTADNDQGNKQAALDSKDLPGFTLLSTLLAGPLSFPSRLSVTYVRLGNFSLGAVPLEMSTTAGYRIRKPIEATGEVFQLLGLTNGYASYAATASEYAAQDYMGASTLWGPNEAEFFRCQLANLRTTEPEKKYNFPDVLLGLTDPFDAAIVGQERDLPDEDLEEIIRDDKQMPVRQLPVFEWSERVPNSEKYTAASKRHIWVTTQSGQTVDATDFGFIKILKEAPIGDCQVWDAIWLRPLLEKVPAVDYVFHVTTAKGDTLTSNPFQVNLNSTTKPSPVKPVSGQPSCN